MISLYRAARLNESRLRLVICIYVPGGVFRYHIIYDIQMGFDAIIILRGERAAGIVDSSMRSSEYGIRASRNIINFHALFLSR